MSALFEGDFPLRVLISHKGSKTSSAVHFFKSGRNGNVELLECTEFRLTTLTLRETTSSVKLLF